MMRTTEIKKYGDIVIERKEGKARRRGQWKQVTFIYAYKESLEDCVEFMLINDFGDWVASIHFLDGWNNERLEIDRGITDEQFSEIVNDAENSLKNYYGV